MVNQLIVIKSLIFNILFFLLSAIVGIVFFPVLISKNLSVKISSEWAKITLYMLNKICGIKINIEGLEIYSTKKVIFAVRHESALETILFLAYFP